MEALQRAGNLAQGADVYVTLEPCSHRGQSPPCADALISAGVARVVVATIDRDPRVSGRGLEKLKDAGIAVKTMVCEPEANRINAGFFLNLDHNRPFFTLKTASTLDGRIALSSGESQWITGIRARAAVHGLRARYDAILVGSGTVLNDDPELTCRIPGYRGRPKVRIILDRRGRTPKDSKIAVTAQEIPTWLITARGSNCKILEAQGIEIISVLANSDVEFIINVSSELAKRGITRVIVEGGGGISASFLKADFIDEIVWFRAGSLIGVDGVSAVGPLSLERMTDIPAFKHRESLVFGDDRLDILDRARD
tara:strand:- start:47 stop:979 length:933 start_codon:yes stop_codon:yes gene_type:complete